MLPRLFRISWNRWWRSFFCFKREMTFLGKFRQKNQNCSCNLKFGSESNSNIPNSMVMLTFSVLHWKYPFWANFVQKNQNYLYKLKFGTECNLSILNPIIIFTFSFLDRKHRFWGKLVQKLKFVCLRWNLVHKRIQICRIWWWWCLFFLFWPRNTLFGNIGPKLSTLYQVFA